MQSSLSITWMNTSRRGLNGPAVSRLRRQGLKLLLACSSLTHRTSYGIGIGLSLHVGMRRQPTRRQRENRERQTERERERCVKINIGTVLAFGNIITVHCAVIQSYSITYVHLTRFVTRSYIVKMSCIQNCLNISFFATLLLFPCKSVCSQKVDAVGMTGVQAGRRRSAVDSVRVLRRSFQSQWQALFDWQLDEKYQTTQHSVYRELGHRRRTRWCQHSMHRCHNLCFCLMNCKLLSFLKFNVTWPQLLQRRQNLIDFLGGWQYFVKTNSSVFYCTSKCC